MKYKTLVTDKNLSIGGHPTGLYISENMKLANAMAKRLSIHYYTPKSQPILRFVCSGSSGAILSALVYKELLLIDPNLRVLEVVHIKKEGEKCHYPGHSIANLDYVKNVIIDDFIGSGETVARIYNTFRANPLEKIDCIIVGGDVRKESCYLETVEFETLICQGI